MEMTLSGNRLFPITPHAEATGLVLGIFSTASLAVIKLHTPAATGAMGNPRSISSMVLTMLSKGLKFKVFDAVIRLVAVLVVDEFRRKKKSLKVLFHDIAMFKYPTPSARVSEVEPYIASFIDIAFHLVDSTKSISFLQRLNTKGVISWR